MKKYYIDDSLETRKALQRLAREQMKMQLLADIRIDLIVCELEGWEQTEFINELKELINDIGKSKYNNL